MDDPFAFMEGFQISSSQEEILRNCPLVQPVDLPGGGVPETAQDAAEHGVSLDILINLPKEQPYLRPCTCNKGVQTDDEIVTQGFDGAICVDLGDDSDFRFSLDDRTMVAGSSRGNYDVCEEIENSIQISGRELSPKDILREPPHKRMKTSIAAEECVENIESRERNHEAEKLACTDGGSKEVSEVAESSEKIVGDVLQKARRIAERVKDMTKGKNDDEKAASFVVDVLKALTEEEASEKEDNLENVSFLELARSRGFKFPTPRWWKDPDT